MPFTIDHFIFLTAASQSLKTIVCFSRYLKCCQLFLTVLGVLFVGRCPQSAANRPTSSSHPSQPDTTRTSSRKFHSISSTSVSSRESPLATFVYWVFHSGAAFWLRSRSLLVPYYLLSNHLQVSTFGSQSSSSFSS